jgi:hypothetical protein
MFVGALITDNKEHLSLGYEYLTEKEYNRECPTVPNVHKKYYRWCSDPYIMYYNNLFELEKKIGKFTKADENERYDYYKHGIGYGEVGFPTELSMNNIPFIGIDYSKWIISFDSKSNVVYNTNLRM